MAPSCWAARSLEAGVEFAMRSFSPGTPAASMLVTTGPPIFPAPITATVRRERSGRSAAGLSGASVVFMLPG